MRVGIVGTGLFARTHIAGYAMLPDVQVVAATDVVPGRAAEFATEHGIRYAFDNLDALLTCDEVDVVDVITPPRAHLDPVRAALASGKPVLCEKPLAIDVDEAAAMAEAARISGLPAVTSFNRRFDPAVRYVRDLVRSGYIGEHRMTTVHLLTTWKRHHVDDRGPYRDWLSSQASGGGFLRGSMPHYADLLRFLLGEIRIDTSLFVSIDAGNDDILLVTGTDGSAGAYSVSMTWAAAADEGERWVIAGSERTITIEPSGSVHAIGFDGARQNLPVPCDYIPETVGGTHGFGFGGAGSWAFAAQVDQLRRKLIDPSYAPAYATFEDGLRSAELIDAIYRRARSSQRT